MFDPHRIKDLFENNCDVIDLISTFVNESKNDLLLIEKAISKEDFEKLLFLIHKVKPSINYLSEDSFSEFTNQIYSSKSNNISDYLSFLKLFKELNKEAIAYLNSQNGKN
jgi:hypothetical protein